MTALVLDPIYESFEDRASKFAQLAEQRMSRPIRRLPFFEGKMDGRQWCSDVLSAIDEAEILICLGDFTILRQFGSDTPQLINTIKEKSARGCPVLFQLVGMRHRLDRKIAPDGMEQLLRSFGCNPTDTKVGSDSYATTQHESSYVCEYNIEDNCLNDPELCEGITKVVGQNAYLLDYEAGSFPIIEASPLHYLVDAKSDLFTSGVPGRRNALGIRRRNGHELQIILSIDVLRNGFSSLGAT